MIDCAAQAFEEIVNMNIGSYRMSELLAMFCDLILRGKEKMSEDVAQDTLERVVRLLMYMTDRDVFLENYRQMLAKRLLQPRCDALLERFMIGCIKVSILGGALLGIE